MPLRLPAASPRRAPAPPRFLDRLATHILAAEGDGKWTYFEGNFQEYEDDRFARLGRSFEPPFATLA